MCRKTSPSIAGVLALFWAACLIVLSIWPAGQQLLDFGAFWSSGRALHDGFEPYSDLTILHYMQTDGFTVTSANLNPPPLLPLFALLAYLKPVSAFRVWSLLSLIFYFISVWWLLRIYGQRRFVLPWSLLSAGLWSCLQFGQVYTLLALLSVVAWICLEQRRYVLAGVAIGVLVAIKPNFAVWPVMLLFAGHLRPVLFAALSGIACNLLAALAYGPDAYSAWIGAVAQNPQVLAAPTNLSLPALFARFGLPFLGYVTAAILLLALAWVAYCRRLPTAAATGFGLAGALLSSPVAWIGYTVVLLPLFLSRAWSRAQWVAAVLLIVPQAAVWVLSLASPLHAAILGVLYPSALLALLFSWLPNAPSLLDRFPLLRVVRR